MEAIVRIGRIELCELLWPVKYEEQYGYRGVIFKQFVGDDPLFLYITCDPLNLKDELEMQGVFCYNYIFRIL